MQSRPIYSDADFGVELRWKAGGQEPGAGSEVFADAQGEVWLILRGTLLQEQAKILKTIGKTLLKNPVQQICIDLSGVQAISHRAIRVLIAFTRQCDRRGIDWKLAPLNETLSLVFKESGLLDYFYKKARR